MPEPAAPPTADQPTVTVVGEGTASAVPDTALLHLGVETRGATPGEALEACSRALEEVIAAVRVAGVEPPRLATGELGLNPDWEARPEGQQRPAGYRAAARLTARLDAPARAGQVLPTSLYEDRAARVDGLRSAALDAHQSLRCLSPGVLWLVRVWGPFAARAAEGRGGLGWCSKTAPALFGRDGAGEIGPGAFRDSTPAPGRNGPDRGFQALVSRLSLAMSNRAERSPVVLDPGSSVLLGGTGQGRSSGWRVP